MYQQWSSSVNVHRRELWIFFSLTDVADVFGLIFEADGGMTASLTFIGTADVIT